jgi:hypothetical protein
MRLARVPAAAAVVLPLAVLATWPAGPQPPVGLEPARKSVERFVPVSTSTGLARAIARIRPGDRIVLADGEYDGAFVLRGGGTERRPVVVRAAARGRAALVGDAALTIDSAAWVIVDGLRFSQSRGVRLLNSAHVRLTRSVFRLTESPGAAGDRPDSVHWLSIRGARSHDNRIDHNLFEHKRAPGHFVLVEGSRDPAALSQRDRIDHNHFRDVEPFGEGMETVRIGVSHLSMQSARTVLEENLFERCDGDMEIVSIKACDVTVRYNTVLDSQGALTARHGHRARFVGNTVLGRGRTHSGGIRLYGDDHQVIGNYVEGVRDEPGGLAAIALDNGDLDHPPPYGPRELVRHFRVRRALVAFNTLVGNHQTLRIGATSYVRAADGAPPESWTRGPLDPAQPPTGLIADNILAGDTVPLVDVITPSPGLRWERNVLFASGGGWAGLSRDAPGVLLIDPRLVRRGGRLMLAPDSPAIDRAGEHGPRYDIEGQPRVPPLDAGADEYVRGAKVRRPVLTAADLGAVAPAHDGPPSAASPWAP